MPHSTVKPLLSNRAYDLLRFVVQIVLPATGTLYFTIATIWQLPAAEQIVGTLAAVALFMGATLGISRRTYQEDEPVYDGALVVDLHDPLKDTYTFEMTVPFEELTDKKDLRLKVKQT